MQANRDGAALVTRVRRHANRLVNNRRSQVLQRCCLRESRRGMPPFHSSTVSAHFAVCTQLNKWCDSNGLPHIHANDMPELSLKYTGYGSHIHTASCPGVSRPDQYPLLSLRVPSRPQDGQSKVPLEQQQPGFCDEMLEYMASSALGRNATPADIERYRTGLLGERNTWGVNGDIYALSTWQKHFTRSQIERSNTDAVWDDEFRDYADDALCCIRDGEHPFELQIRAATSSCDADVAPYKLSNAHRSSTYRHLYEAHVAQLHKPTGRRSFSVKRAKRQETKAVPSAFHPKRHKTNAVPSAFHQQPATSSSGEVVEPDCM